LDLSVRPTAKQPDFKGRDLNCLSVSTTQNQDASHGRTVEEYSRIRLNRLKEVLEADNPQGKSPDRLCNARTVTEKRFLQGRSESGADQGGSGLVTVGRRPEGLGHRLEWI
jgi:hypothetical protein